MDILKNVPISIQRMASIRIGCFTFETDLMTGRIKRSVVCRLSGMEQVQVAAFSECGEVEGRHGFS